MIYTMNQVAKSRGFDNIKFIEWAKTSARLHGAFDEIGTNELVITTWNFDELISAAREAGFTRTVPY